MSTNSSAGGIQNAALPSALSPSGKPRRPSAGCQTGQGPTQTQTPWPDDASTLQAALTRLQEIILDGLSHGFFDYRLTCEVVTGKKRRLVIWAGKSHRFVIAEDELRRF